MYEPSDKKAASQGQVPVLLRALGLAPYLTWGYVSFYSPVLFPSAREYLTYSRLVFLVSLFAISATLLLTLRFADRSRPINSRRYFLYGAPSLAALGTLLMAFSFRQQALDPAVLAVTGSLATGIGTAWLVVSWGEYFGALGIRATSRYIPASFLLGIALFFLVSSLRPIPAILTTVALPVASVVMLRLSVLALPSSMTGREEYPDQKWEFPRGLALSVAAYAAAFSYLRGANVGWMGAADGMSDYFFFFLGLGLSALALGLNVVFSKRALDVTRVYRLALALGVAGFLVLPFVGGRYTTLTATVVGAAWSYFDMVVWIVLSDIIFRVRKPAVEVLGWGRFCAHAGMLVGALLGVMVAAVAPSGSVIGIAASLMIAYALVLLGMFSGKNVSAYDAWGASEEVVVTTQPATLDERCAKLARQYRLTPREREALCLMARGRNVAYIQQAMGLSNATAKTHVHHVYTKLGVHDRQQLLNLVDREE